MEKKKDNAANGVSDIDIIQQKMEGNIVELPPFFENDEPFNVRLGRISLLEMASADIIPNELLTSVNELYSKGVQGLSDIKDTARTFIFIAEKALKEPTYKELKDKGITLTDAQLLSIYLYAVAGVRALKNFRKE